VRVDLSSVEVEDVEAGEEGGEALGEDMLSFYISICMSGFMYSAKFLFLEMIRRQLRK